MRTAGMNGVSRLKSPSRIKKNQSEGRAGDVLHRDFTAAAPNTLWVPDLHLRDNQRRVDVHRVHRRCGYSRYGVPI